MENNRRRNDVVTKGMVGALMAILLFILSLPGQRTDASLDKEKGAAVMTTGAADGKRGTDDQANRNTEAAENTYAVLWEDPVELESRDLFFFNKN